MQQPNYTNILSDFFVVDIVVEAVDVLVFSMYITRSFYQIVAGVVNAEKGRRSMTSQIFCDLLTPPLAWSCSLFIDFF